MKQIKKFTPSFILLKPIFLILLTLSLYFRSIMQLKQIKYKLKKPLIILFPMLFLLLQCSKPSESVEISIPDKQFLNALTELGIDRDRNGQVSLQEAEAAQTIRIWPSNIHDLAGIEYFTNLDTLSITMNPLSEPDLSQNKSLKYLELVGCGLTSLDLSSNSELVYLDCESRLAMKNYITTLDLSANIKLEFLSCIENQLTTLNLSSNSHLKSLHCGYNKLSSLDVSLNTNLNTLHCNNNFLTSLYVSRNTALTSLITCGNDFSSFDISNNTNLVKIGIDNMPTLQKVCVWTLPFPPDGIVVLMGFSPNIEFSLGCGE